MFLQILIQSNKQLHTYSRAMHHVVRGDKLHSWQTNLKSFDHDVLVYYSIWKGISKILDQEKYYHRLLWHGLSVARSLSKLENRHCRWNNKHFNHLRSQPPVLLKYIKTQISLVPNQLKYTRKQIPEYRHNSRVIKLFGPHIPSLCLKILFLKINI